MTQPRRRLVSLDATPYYHCVSRCVRRAFLCGFDSLTERSFEHRRQWIEDRIHKISEIFAIDLCAYAVMSNHYHVVIRLNADEACQWDAQEVIERWSRLYEGPPLVQRLQADQSLSAAELEAVSEIIETWRERLCSLSWFMRSINEPIARQANQEDGCTGRFWEGRFKSQALLDEQALLQCMAYVDLNPIRAAIAKTPEESEHTSIRARTRKKDGSLSAFEPTKDNCALPFPFADYLELVDWTGRVIREDKRGAIPADTPPILERLGLEPESWCKTSRHFGKWTYRIVGTAESMKQAARSLGQRWFKGPPLDQAPT